MGYDRSWVRLWGVLAIAAAVVGLQPAGADPFELQNKIADIAAQVKPCVVSITSTRAPAGDLRLPGGRQPQFGQARGTGMLFRETDEYYYILTNAHVVRGAKDNKVQVKLVAERSEREGVVIGVPDRRTDTALVRIDRNGEEKLPLVKFGTVEDLRVGDFVLAVGSPFDFEASVTFGVVSSLNRELEEPLEGAENGAREHYRGLIQTDASINPGNSGGPLVDLKGEVIGINFAIFSPGAAGNIGIGFAIPIDRSLPVINDLLEHGHAVRGYLGIYVVSLDDQAKALDVTFDQLKELLGTDIGVYVDRVSPDGPAGQAGLESGDVILAVNGQKVNTSGELVDRVSGLAPGTEVKLDILRATNPLSINVTLGMLPVQAPQPGAAPPVGPAAKDPLSLQLEVLTPDKAKELGVAPQGLLLTGIGNQDLAAKYGLVPGTVLLAGRRPGQEFVAFKTVDDYLKLVSGAAEKGELITLRVNSPLGEQQRAQRNLLVKIPKPETEGNDE